MLLLLLLLLLLLWCGVAASAAASITCVRYKWGPLVKQALGLLVQLYSQRESFIKCLPRVQVLLDQSKIELRKVVRVQIQALLLLVQ